ncbi:MAG TPA: hypothetical protein VGW39_02425 [Chthoniobacterales bacterium]|nr:hypothetical protein [Chthoniobacterales bacterium]
MSSPTTTEDLLDLKLLPSWVNEPARPNDYADFEGEDPGSAERAGRRPRERGRDRDRRSPQSRDPRGPQSREQRPRRPRPDRPGPARREETNRGRDDRREREPVAPPLAVTVRFVPHAPAFNSVVAQIKSGSVAYSVFALARLFLEKPERYDVQLTTAEDRPLFQLGENGPVSSDRHLLETSAFAAVRDDFYAAEVTQNEPLKGNFTNVARCRLSGTLLGPTNHHNYQPQLRTLYETRFSRRMSFIDYQKQIEIVSDPAVVEEWKEQARNVTTYTAKTGEPPLTFTNPAEVERHFRQHHLPGLVRSASELTIGGVASRRLSDRRLGRAIEEAWSSETRSPSKMMQELSAGLRQGGLNIFRHRRGMLFVSPIRTRVFSHESAGVSASINAILEKVGATPGINRKQLSEQLAPAGAEPADLERAKLTLASDLHWLVSEGYVIEFNDGSLDLPRTKPPATPAVEEKPAATIENKPAEPIVEVQPVEQESAAAIEASQAEPAAEAQRVEEVKSEVATDQAPIEAAVEEPAVAAQNSGPSSVSADSESAT